MWRGLLDELLDEDAVVGEAGAASLPAERKPSRSLGSLAQPHALAAAARRGLDHHRIADLAARSRPPAAVGDRRNGRARRDPGRRASFFDSILSPIAAIGVGSGADEDDPASASATAKPRFSERKP
jgi:hypothetical protein